MAGHGTERTTAVLRISLAATFLYVLITFLAGIRAHSLALISEAGHNASDFLALLLSWGALWMQSRPPTSTKTFGYHRAGVLAAFINALTLVGVAFYIFYEALRRLAAPQAVQPRLMVYVAAAGVLMNGAIALLLFRNSHKSDVNIRSSFVHMLGDTVSTAAVIVGGWAIYLTGKNWIDPALSFGIAALILWSSWGIIRETLNILLEGTPRGVDVDRILARVRAIEGVNQVHDLHVWSIGSDSHSLSCHIGIADIPPSASEGILRQVKDVLRNDFHIHHTTIQFEHEECEVAHGCVIPAGSIHHGHTH